MDMETYEEVIDSYNISSEKKKGMSLTDYIKTNNIKIKEIEMSPLEDLRKAAKKADGGFMRKNYAMGSDEDEFPEAEDMPTDEYLELLKQLGAPMPGQESGIRRLNKMASDDANERLLEKIYEDLLEEGFTPEEAAQKARQMFDEMAGKKPVIDPMLLDQYLKYVDEMREMGREPMSLRQFTEQARAGAQVGGLASII